MNYSPDELEAIAAINAALAHPATPASAILGLKLDLNDLIMGAHDVSTYAGSTVGVYAEPLVYGAFSTWFPTPEAEAVSSAAVSVYSVEPKGLPESAPQPSVGELNALTAEANALLSGTPEGAYFDPISPTINLVGGKSKVAFNSKTVFGDVVKAAQGTPDATKLHEVDPEHELVSTPSWVEAIDYLEWLASDEGAEAVAMAKAAKAAKVQAVAHAKGNATKASTSKHAKLVKQATKLVASGKQLPKHLAYLLEEVAEVKEVVTFDVFPATYVNDVVVGEAHAPVSYSPSTGWVA